MLYEVIIICVTVYALFWRYWNAKAKILEAIAMKIDDDDFEDYS